jgi:hypothetical protein
MPLGRRGSGEWMIDEGEEGNEAPGEYGGWAKDRAVTERRRRVVVVGIVLVYESAAL